MTRSGLVLALVFVVSGCQRGCSWGARPAETCDDNADCGSGACRGGYCVSASYARTDDGCRADPACAERGECTAITKRSFLGLDRSLECAAVSDQDCRLSRRCATHGACARVGFGDVGCGAASAAQCGATVRCATDEECALRDFQCVRDWSACPELPSPERPAWAAPVALVWDFESLRAPWQPGNLEAATLACRIDGKGEAHSMLRIAGQCAGGPRLDDGRSKFLRADVALHPGDAIAIALQDGPTAHASGAPLVQLRYAGASPMRAERDGVAVECVVVPHDVALARSVRERAAVDRELAKVREVPDLANARAAGEEVDAAIEAAHVHAGRAALWLGWRDPELATRVRASAAALATWQAHLDTAIRQVHGSALPIRAKRVAIESASRICGAALRTRYGWGAAAPAIGDDTCALELGVRNASTTSITLEARSGALDEISDLAWLRPARDAEPAQVVPATIAAIQVGPAVAPAGSVELPPGELALVLVDGLGTAAVLHGRIGYRTAFALRR